MRGCTARRGDRTQAAGPCAALPPASHPASSPPRHRSPAGTEPRPTRRRWTSRYVSGVLEGGMSCGGRGQCLEPAFAAGGGAVRAAQLLLPAALGCLILLTLPGLLAGVWARGQCSAHRGWGVGDRDSGWVWCAVVVVRAAAANPAAASRCRRAAVRVRKALCANASCPPTATSAVTAEGGQGPWRACFRVSKGQVRTGGGAAASVARACWEHGCCRRFEPVALSPKPRPVLSRSDPCARHSVP